MSKSWIPLKDLAMQAFCNGFLATVQSVPTNWGLAAGDVTSLTTATTSYNDALATLAEPSTHTRPAVAAKRIARVNLLALMRNLYKKVRAANLSQDKLEALGLPIPVLPSPIPPPAMAPTIHIVSRTDNTIRLKFTDPTDPTRRGRPAGVDGIAVFSHVAENPPNTELDWTFQGNTTRMTIDVTFPASVTPGSKVWLTAFFFNPRALSGPAASPVSTYLPGGAAMAETA